MQTLPEITARAILRKNKYIWSCKNIDTLPKWSANTMLKLIWRQGFIIVLIPTHYFVLSLVLFLFFPYFSTHLDNDESAAAGGKEKSAPFKAPVCTETWTASKSGSTTIDSHHLRTRTGPYLSGRPRVNEAQKWKKWFSERKSLRQQPLSNNPLLCTTIIFFLDVISQEEILYSERNWANKTSIYSSYIRYQVSFLVQCIFRENMSSAINSLMLPVGMSHTQILHPR